MTENCASACTANPEAGEPEQCVGWAQQGECTRNPKYMMEECPVSCKEQRSQMHEGALDDLSNCLELASAEECRRSDKLQKNCAGTCVTHELCAEEADPAECERALRCRELKDDWADCKSRVEKEGCMDSASLLKHCYLSCARHGQAGLLRRFRLKYTVRTRRHGLIDEEPRFWRSPAGEPTLSLPCWKQTLFDPPPPATCNSTRAQRLQRWRRMAEPRCAALAHTTPRTARRRVLRLPAEHRPRSSLDDAGGKPAAGEGDVDSTPAVSVLPLLTSPKLRLVEHFVSAEEAAHIIDVGLPRMHRSLAGGRTESIRTSTTAMLPANDPVVRRVTERAALVTGYPYANIEPLQLVKYVDGQKYEPHFDYGEACDFEENLGNGHRHVTMLVYLNTVPEDRGGYTAFPKLNLRLSPSAHAAIVFNDCLPNGEEDPRTLHGGSPPSNHTKIAINIWIRAKNRAGASGFMGMF